MRRSVIALGCPEDKVRIHHLGVCIESLRFEPRTWLPTHELRVLIAGSFVEKKGIPYALQALGKIREEVRLAVTIIGEARANPRGIAERERILNAIATSGLASNVRMLGYQPHEVLIREAYSHHIFMSPSVTAGDGDCEGGAPVTIVEMAATGMPVVSTLHCDIPNVLRDGYSGLLAQERDVRSLTQFLRQLVKHPDLWVTLVTATRNRIVAEFDAREQGAKLARIYRSILTPPEQRNSALTAALREND